MRRTKARLWICATGSVFSALSTRIWTDHAAALQMAAYSGIVLGLLFVGFREDRGRPGFRRTALLVVVLHAAALYAAASLFPVRSTFLLWIAAGVEGTMLGLVFVILVGKDPRLMAPRRPGLPRPVEPLRRRAISVAGGRVGR